MSAPIVLYVGPSMINGAPIVVLATLDSRNVKTGPMIQTWIVPENGPLDATKNASDDSVCGDCPRRRSTGGDCYVRIDAAPNAAWKKWDRAGRPGVNWDESLALQAEGRDHGLRMGAYGDPAAVPFHVWRDLIDAIDPKVITGYTHQWMHGFASEFRTVLMASCDNVADATQASALGWRYFAAVPTSAQAIGLPGKSVQCLSDSRGITCEECGICNGARADRTAQPVSVWIAEHGPMSSAKAKRVRALSVLA